jgi:Cu2+-exporting ATPase
MDHTHSASIDDSQRADAHTGSDHGGHDKHEGHSPEMFRDRLVVSFVLTVPILYLSPQVQEWFGFTAIDFSWDRWVSPVLASVLYSYAGLPFLRGAARELRDRMPGMMTLVALAISVAYLYSLAVSFGFEGDPFYWELATLLDVMLLGHWIEMRSVQSASKALEHLATLIPDTARLLGSDGSISEVPISELREGDVVMVRAGEQVPADGEIAEGRSSVSEAFLTGESRPIPKGPGDEVVAGSVNGDGTLSVTVGRTGSDTTLSQIMRLVAEAQASRSRYQALADRAAMWLTVGAIGVAVPTLVAWLVFGTRGASFAAARAVTVLVIACPHALGLAIPLVTSSATTVAARSGILVRNREAFERGSKVVTVAFDKTGTLTEGRFEVTGITARADVGPDEALAAAASLEKGSEHPLAAAIVAAAEERELATPPAEEMETEAGSGIRGRIDDRLLRVGRPEWAEEIGASTSEEITDALELAAERGESAIVLFDDHSVDAVFRLADRVRDSARDAVDRLREAGVESVMITGDAEAVARTVAGELDIERYYARVLPEDKARIVAGLKEEGVTAFVGDGINDAPALLEADLGLAIGAGTDVAVESADLVLVDDDPGDVATALGLAATTRRKMLQNLAWATGYNVVTVPLAAGIAVPAGIVLEPAIGGLLMSGSTVIVALNAMSIRRTETRGGGD